MVGLVLPDQDWMGHRQQPHQSSMLQEFQDLALVCQAPAENVNSQNHRFGILKFRRLLVNADLFHLRHQHLEKAHDRLQGQFTLPALHPIRGRDPLLGASLRRRRTAFSQLQASPLRTQKATIYNFESRARK